MGVMLLLQMGEDEEGVALLEGDADMISMELLEDNYHATIIATVEFEDRLTIWPTDRLLRNV